jgi:hypothetical protein
MQSILMKKMQGISSSVLAISSVIRSGVLYRIVGGCASDKEQLTQTTAVSLLLQSINKLHNCTWQGMRALSIDVAESEKSSKKRQKSAPQ